ncbi:hypothetical protein EI555_003049 [Monodon monoceros]|uniref:UEV domain-containing protein n=1 Tax=Monodon monoceros TaxID=40151 RepID=A0A4U1FR35_MONMO|nr:hypothetical protein EI555_003049 [Monodon monoceros]
MAAASCCSRPVFISTRHLHPFEEEWIFSATERSGASLKVVDAATLSCVLGHLEFPRIDPDPIHHSRTPVFSNLRYSVDTYVFKDSSQKNLLNFTGTIPVMYQA